MKGRLFLKGISDTGQKQFVCTGERQVAVAVFWGPRSENLAVHLTVDWKEGRDKPTVHILLGEEILEEGSGV